MADHELEPGDPPVDHRRLAIDLFNATWGLLDRTDRTPADDLDMVHSAHASRHHWGQAGTELHWARGEWQISRVYAVVGRAEPALVHAQRCLELCQANGFGDFDLAFAYEALARASAVAGAEADRARWMGLAREAAKAIADDDDRLMVVADLDAIEALSPREQLKAEVRADLAGLDLVSELLAERRADAAAEDEA